MTLPATQAVGKLKAHRCGRRRPGTRAGGAQAGGSSRRGGPPAGRAADRSPHATAKAARHSGIRRLCGVGINSLVTPKGGAGCNGPKGTAEGRPCQWQWPPCGRPAGPGRPVGARRVRPAGACRPPGRHPAGSEHYPTRPSGAARSELTGHRDNLPRIIMSHPSHRLPVSLQRHCDCDRHDGASGPDGTSHCDLSLLTSRSDRDSGSHAVTISESGPRARPGQPESRAATDEGIGS